VSSIEISNSGGIKGLDTAACPTANCIQTNGTSNGSTGVMTQSLTLSSTGELVLFLSTPSVGPVGITSGWTGAIIGSTSATLSNLYCNLTTPFCINEVQSSFKSSASSGAFTSSATDHTKSDVFDAQSFALLPTASTNCKSCDMSRLSAPDYRISSGSGMQ
jgi:hypothetical protein